MQDLDFQEQLSIVTETVSNQKKLTYLKVGDRVGICTSRGDVLAFGEVERIVNSYAVVDKHKYWVRGIDGKHRDRTNYMQFLMTEKEARAFEVKIV